MQCPTCASELRLTERHHIEIDYCPQCRGVWLDRGELDKIIERATTRTAPRSYAEPDAFADWERDDDKHYERKGRRRSFLSELFDFD